MTKKKKTILWVCFSFVALAFVLAVYFSVKGVVLYREVRNPRTGAIMRERYPDNPPPSPSNVSPIFDGKRALHLDASHLKEFIASTFSKDAQIKLIPYGHGECWDVTLPPPHPIDGLGFSIYEGKVYSTTVVFRQPVRDRAVAFALLGLESPTKRPDINCDGASWYGFNGFYEVKALYVTPLTRKGCTEPTWQVDFVELTASGAARDAVERIE